MVNEGDVISKIIETFPGARVVTKLDPPLNLDHKLIAANRGKVRHRIVKHEYCDYQYQHTPVPFSGPSMAAFTVIGEAPGKEEEQVGRPFVGKSGRLLRALLGPHFDPDDVFWMNTMTCHPKKEGSTRAPTTKEMTSQRSIMLDSLALSSSQHVLLVGATALSSFRGDLKLSSVHGQVFIWKSKYIVMPVFHPALILRKQELKSDLARDLKQWADVLKGNWHRYLGRGCVKCPNGVYELDPDGVGYCQGHWDRYGMKSWQKAQKKWVVSQGEQTSVWDYADPMKVNEGGDYV